MENVIIKSFTAVVVVAAAATAVVANRYVNLLKIPMDFLVKISDFEMKQCQSMQLSRKALKAKSKILSFIIQTETA